MGKTPVDKLSFTAYDSYMAENTGVYFLDDIAGLIRASVFLPSLQRLKLISPVLFAERANE